MNETVKLNLSREGLEYIWQLLLRAPYGDVAPLIAEINRQVADQAQPPTPNLAPEASKPKRVYKPRSRKTAAHANGAAGAVQ